MALVDVGSDAHAWEKEYESAQKLHFSLLSFVNERENHPKNSQPYNKLSSQLHQGLNQLSSEIKSLKAYLEKLGEHRKITSREKERRSLMIEELLSKQKQLQSSLNSSNNARTSLLGEYQTLETSEHTTATRAYGHIPHQSLRQMQTQAIAEQDRGLEELSKIIGRQKEMARTIGDEVESQNDLIDNITDGVERTRDRMAQQTTRIGLVDRKDRACGYWLVIIGLMVAIIVIASIPKL